MAENKSKGMMVFIIALLVVLSGLLVFMLITMLGMRGDDVDEERAPMRIAEFERLRVHNLSATPRTTNLLRGADGRQQNMRMGISIMVYRGDERDRGDTERYEELIALLTRMEPAILDLQIRYMRNLTVRDATRAEAETIAAEALTQRLQDMFQTNLIVNVVFNEFAVL